MLVVAMACGVAMPFLVVCAVLGAALLVVWRTRSTAGLADVSQLVSVTLDGLAKIAAALRKAPRMPAAPADAVPAGAVPAGAIPAGAPAAGAMSGPAVSAASARQAAAAAANCPRRCLDCPTGRRWRPRGRRRGR